MADAFLGEGGVDKEEDANDPFHSSADVQFLVAHHRNGGPTEIPGRVSGEIGRQVGCRCEEGRGNILGFDLVFGNEAPKQFLGSFPDFSLRIALEINRAADSAYGHVRLLAILVRSEQDFLMSRDVLR